MAITQLKCDVHTHTLYSQHAYSTIWENVQQAAALGLELLGSTDHFGAQFFPTPAPEEVGRLLQFWHNQAVWPRVWNGVRIMRGCEVDIVDIEGHLNGYDRLVTHTQSGVPIENPRSVKDDVLDKMDYAIASLHTIGFVRDTTKAQNTQMYINALQEPKVLVLGHIGRTPIDFDIDAVVTAARDLGKLIEINEHTFDSSNGRLCRSIAERCAELGCKIIVSTDAHICTSIGRFANSVAMLNDIDFPETLIASRNASAFEFAYEESGIGVMDWTGGSLPSLM